MIPGGHVEARESPAEAALREVAEETGLTVRLVAPPAAPLPPVYRPPRVAQPWWIVEYQVPPDNHLDEAHVHVDYLYVAIAGRAGPAAEPDHRFGWYRAGDLAGLHMFEDGRILAGALLASLDGSGPGHGGPGSDGPDEGGPDGGVAAAILAGLQPR